MGILHLNKKSASPAQQDIAARLDEKLTQLDDVLQEAKDLIHEFKETDEPDDDTTDQGHKFSA